MKEGWYRFVKLCHRAKTPKQLAQLFELFFTPAEKEAMALRLSLVQALLEGELTQREISEELGISIAKITRGSNALKRVSNDIKQLVLSDL